jgi:predicted DNA-binding ribbon-helix-helix protein
MITTRRSGTRKSPLGASLNAKRSVVINGHKTSVSVEKQFWDALKEIAFLNGIGLQELITKIDQDRDHSNLSSAIRLFVLGSYRAKDRNITG